MRFLFLILFFTSQGQAYFGSHYRIEGYKKMEIKNNKKIFLEAKNAQGLGNISFEELEKIKITIEESDLTLQAASDHALFKNNELILDKNVELKLIKNKKNLLKVKSAAPDHLMYLNLEKNTITIPAYDLTVPAKKEIKGRSLIINLNDRSLQFIQPLKDKSIKLPSHF